jgi:RNA-binding protein
MPKTLTPEARQALKSRAHALHPVVMIGNDGLTEAVLKEIDASLKAHELIKVRTPAAGREAREQLLAGICDRTGAQAVQHIGRILVIYREKPPEPAPPRAAAPARKKPARPAAAAPGAAKRFAPRPGTAGAAMEIAPSRPGRAPRLLPKRGRPTRSGRR